MRLTKGLRAKDFLTLPWSFFCFARDWGVFTVIKQKVREWHQWGWLRFKALLQLTPYPWWRNEHLFISLLSHLWPLWSVLLSLKPLLHPHHIPSSNSDDALCCNIGSEDSSLLIAAMNWTHPYCCTSGWCFEFGSRVSKEHHYPQSPFVFWRVLHLLVGPVTTFWNLQGSRWRLTQLSMGEALNYQH